MTELESRIYRELIGTKKATVAELSRSTGIHRRNIYDAADRMLKKGFIVVMKENNTLVYKPADPSLIHRQLEQRMARFESMLPGLMQQFMTQQEKRETLFFHGRKGLRLIFEDQLRTGAEICVNATTSAVDDILRFFFPNYHRERESKGIHTRMIFNKEYESRGPDLAKIPLCQVRFIENFNRSPVSHYIYGANVAIAVWTDDPVAILIREEAIAQSFRDNFELLWRT